MEQPKKELVPTVEDDKTVKKFYQEMEEKDQISPETEKALMALLAKIPNGKKKKKFLELYEAHKLKKAEPVEEGLYKDDDDASTIQSIDNNLGLVNKSDARNFIGADLVTAFGMLLICAFGCYVVKKFNKIKFKVKNKVLGTVEVEATTQANGTSPPQQNGMEKELTDSD